MPSLALPARPVPDPAIRPLSRRRWVPRHALAAGVPERAESTLREMTVSSPELDKLVSAARKGGALGAKMSGGGRGGNMIALVEEEISSAVAEALISAGATRTIITQVS